MIKIDSYIGQHASFVQLRSSNPKLALAMATVTDLDGVLATIDKLGKAAQTSEPVQVTRDQVTVEIHNALYTAGELPHDLLDRYRDAVTSEQAWIAAQDELNGLHRTLVNQRDLLISGGLNDMCQALHTDLQRVYSSLQKVRSAPTTAEQAIAAGKVKEFQKASELRTEYGQIRQAQRMLLANGYAKTLDDSFSYLAKGWPMVGYASNLVSVWVDLPEWDRYGRKPGTTSRWVKLAPPWPDPESPAFLDWLLDHPEAGPWVPTFDQALELLGQIKKTTQVFYEGRSPDQQLLDHEYDRRRRNEWHLPHILN